MACRLPLLLLLLLASSSLCRGQMRVFNLRATGLPSDILGVADGYVKVFIGSTSLGKTSIRHNNPNPWWEEEFSNFHTQVGEVLRLEVHDSDLVFDDLLGICKREVQPGMHDHDCFLEEGGVLHYSYELYSQ